MTTTMNSSLVPFEFFADDRLNNIGDIVRICMTDEVFRPIQDVVDTDISPTNYAGVIVERNLEHLFNYFYDQNNDNPNLSEDHYYQLRKTSPTFIPIYESYAYDQVLMGAVLFRLNMFRDITIQSICETLSEENNLYASALAFLLNHTTDGFECSMYSGLTTFQKIAEFYIESFELSSERMNIHFLSRFAKSVGDMGDENWVLYDKYWAKALVGNEDRVFHFRKFLFVSLIYTTTSLDTLSRIYETNVKDLESDMCEFMELREDPDTNLNDIVTFLDRIQRHTQSELKPNLLFTLFEYPFSGFNEQYRNLYLPHTNNNITYHTNPLDAMLACLSETLGSDWTPDSILNTDASLPDFVNFYITHHKDQIIEGPVFNQYTLMGVDIPNDIDKDDILFVGSIKDYLYMVSAYLRYEQVYPGNGFSMVLQKAHILLSMTDPDLGLSIVAWVLSAHIQTNSKRMSVENVKIVYDIARSIDFLVFAFPSMMNSFWKNILSDEEMREHFRGLMLTIIESLYLETDSEYNAYTARSKYEWFAYIRQFGEFLKVTPTKEELLTFFSKRPSVTESVFLNDQDGIVWCGSFTDLKDNS